MKKLFTDHPATVGETYTQHFSHAGGFGVRMVFSGLACLVHAVLPFLFVKTGSNTITVLHDRMVTNRHNLTPAKEGTQTAEAQR
jgi:hypothetical protein